MFYDYEPNSLALSPVSTHVARSGLNDQPRMSLACSRAPWLRSGLNVIDGCVAGDEIERDRDGVGRPVVGLSFGRSVGR